jgi:hypothetical protein
LHFRKGGKDVLPDPPHCKGYKFKTPGFINLGGFDQPQVPLADQVTQRQAPVLVLLDHRNDKTQIGLR